jgi:hypothetical protein
MQQAVTQANKSQVKSLNQHSAMCSICKHLRRKDIESDYLKFMPNNRIATLYGVANSTVKSHMQIYGLDQLRYRDTQNILDHAIYTNKDKLNHLPVEQVLKAIEMRAKVRGEFVEHLEIDDLRRLDTNSLKSLLFDELKAMAVDITVVDSTDEQHANSDQTIPNQLSIPGDTQASTPDRPPGVREGSDIVPLSNNSGIEPLLTISSTIKVKRHRRSAKSIINDRSKKPGSNREGLRKGWADGGRKIAGGRRTMRRAKKRKVVDEVPAVRSED